MYIRHTTQKAMRPRASVGGVRHVHSWVAQRFVGWVANAVRRVRSQGWFAGVGVSGVGRGRSTLSLAKAQQQQQPGTKRGMAE